MIDRRLLGYVEVDSGTLLVGDPMYVLRHEADGRTGVDYETVLEATSKAQGPVVRLAGQPVLILQQFGGDGSFPVYGEFEDDMFARVVIEFVDAEDSRPAPGQSSTFHRPPPRSTAGADWGDIQMTR